MPGSSFSVRTSSSPCSVIIRTLLQRSFETPLYNHSMLQQLRIRARALEIETHALHLAALDRRTPWFAKTLVLLIVAYAFSPIDLIPDFVPVLGYLDDLIIIPVGIALALRLIPAQVMADARAAARDLHASGKMRCVGAVIIVTLWIVAIILLVVLVRRCLGPGP
ncbi:MAG: YkvA family protein [Chloroflexota bacterium]